MAKVMDGNPDFCFSKRGLGEANEIKMCLHIFINERRRLLADIPVSPPRNNMTVGSYYFLVCDMQYAIAISLFLAE
jgi:hypothetical protein